MSSKRCGWIRSAASGRDTTTVMIYLDNNATTPPAPEVVAAVTGCLQNDWGNPSSKHASGQAAKTRTTQARAEVAGLLGARPAEVVFTSGATEANVWALRAAVTGAPKRRRVVLSAVEHPAMLRAAKRLAQDGVQVDVVPVDRCGLLDLGVLDRVVRPDTALLALMAANNETGVLSPVREAAALAASRDVPMLVDATQAVGRIPVNFSEWGVDLLTCSAHKLHGPKGVGALVMRKGFELPPLIEGSQERGRRGGTENVPGIVGFGVAAALAHGTLAADAERMGRLRDDAGGGFARAAARTAHPWRECSTAAQHQLPAHTKHRFRVAARPSRTRRHLRRVGIGLQRGRHGAVARAAGNGRGTR